MRNTQQKLETIKTAYNRKSRDLYRDLREAKGKKVSWGHFFGILFRYADLVVSYPLLKLAERMSK